MQLPIVAPAPLVTAHADVFRDLFENRCQFQHFQNYLTGLIVLDNKSLTNITRCVLESADKTNLSRFFSEAPWFQARVNDRRVAYLLQQTKGVRSAQADAALILDDTLCEHVGSLFDYVDRHYNHGDDTYPRAHNPVTSHYISGPVRFPVDLRLYRRYEECTQWETFVQKHFPDRPIPRTKIPSCWKIRTFRSSTNSFGRKSISALPYWKRRCNTKCRFVSSCSTVGISPKSWCPWRAIGKKIGSAC